jgi:hypothetical protein
LLLLDLLRLLLPPPVFFRFFPLLLDFFAWPLFWLRVDVRAPLSLSLLLWPSPSWTCVLDSLASSSLIAKSLMILGDSVKK